MTTVADLYQNILGRSPEQAGLEHWTQQFGTSIDPNELATFMQAAQPELAQTGYTPQNLTLKFDDPTNSDNFGPIEPLPSGMTPNMLPNTSLPSPSASNLTPNLGSSTLSPPMTPLNQSATTAPTLLDPTQIAANQQNIAKLYQDILGRAPEQAGLDYWSQQFGSDVSPEELSTFQQAALPELQKQEYVYQMYKNAVGRAPTPQEMVNWANKFGISLDPYELNQFYTEINPEKIQNFNYTTPQNITDLYQQVLGRAPSAEEISNWQGIVGDTIDQSELNKFINASQAELQSSGYKPTAMPYIGYGGINNFNPQAFEQGQHGDINSLMNFYAGRPATPQEYAYFSSKYGNYLDSSELADFKNTLYQGYQNLGAEQYKNIYGTDLNEKQLAIAGGTYGDYNAIHKDFIDDIGGAITSGSMSIDDAAKYIQDNPWLLETTDRGPFGPNPDAGKYTAENLGLANKAFGQSTVNVDPEVQSRIDQLNQDSEAYKAKYTALMSGINTAYNQLFQGATPYTYIDLIKEYTAQLDELKKNAPDFKNYLNEDEYNKFMSLSEEASNPLSINRLPYSSAYYNLADPYTTYGTNISLDPLQYKDKNYKENYDYLLEKYKEMLKARQSGGGFLGLGKIGNLITGGLSLAFPAIAPYLAAMNVTQSLVSGDMLGAGLNAFGLSEASGLTNIGKNLFGSGGAGGIISKILPEGLDDATRAVIANGIVQGGLGAGIAAASGGDPLDALLTSVATAGTQAVLGNVVPQLTASILPQGTNPAITNAVNVAIGSASVAALNAAMHDQDAMTSFLASGGGSLLASSISNNLTDLVENPRLRDYIANAASQMIVNSTVQSFGLPSNSAPAQNVASNTSTNQGNTDTISSVPAKVDVSTLTPVTLPFKI